MAAWSWLASANPLRVLSLPRPVSLPLQRGSSARKKSIIPVTLVQTGVIHQFPVVLMGRDYYQPLLNYMQDMIKAGTISQSDLQYVCLTDDVEEAQQHIRTYVQQNYTIVKRRKPLWWLLERV